MYIKILLGNRSSPLRKRARHIFLVGEILLLTLNSIHQRQLRTHLINHRLIIWLTKNR
jgi:hypothetical protein